ncbi:hypothetical protein K0M31_012267 [Melipona bicolor]|uniref:Uncharacterized protein n=1 Tax=Melipona bicolor TaxID=60889 RepID=A0AA40FKL5_9HYME|nr:hypothetical protein K0M31_012267 [Melipona bicolor]
MRNVEGFRCGLDQSRSEFEKIPKNVRTIGWKDILDERKKTELGRIGNRRLKSLTTEVWEQLFSPSADFLAGSSGSETNESNRFNNEPRDGSPRATAADYWDFQASSEKPAACLLAFNAN